MASKLTGIEKSAFVVYLMVAAPDKVGVGGEMLRERFANEGNNEKMVNWGRGGNAGAGISGAGLCS